MMLCIISVFVAIEGIHWQTGSVICKFFNICIHDWLCVDQCYKCVWFVQGGPCWTWPVYRDMGSVLRPCYCRVPPYWSKTAPPDGHHSTQQVKIPAFRNRHSTKVWYVMVLRRDMYMCGAHPYCDLHCTCIYFQSFNEIIF